MKFIFTFCIICSSVICHAQRVAVDSIDYLKEVTITSSRLSHFSSGSKVENIDSIALQNNAGRTLADLLSSESQIFIKSYGITGLATPSFRGSGASHTAILWNGFNLSSSMNGQLDVALVPVCFLSNVKVQYGGAGALWGSGAMGGTIHLSNKPEFNKGIVASAGINYGSFKSQQQNLEFIFSRNRIILSTKFFHHKAINNFQFKNLAEVGNPVRRLTNAGINQYAFLQEVYFKINQHQTLDFRFWYQLNDRNIAPSMIIDRSQSNQKDEFYRSTIEWQRTKKKIAVYVRSAYFDEILKFIDPAISLVSGSRTASFISEAETRIQINAINSINLGVNNTYNIAITENYLKNRSQNRAALFASYKIANTKNTWSATASARQQFISHGAHPFTASAGLEGWLIKKIRLRGNAGKNYRLPTFNELYWMPGGNAKLLSENGWSEEAGIAFIHAERKLSVDAEISGFSNRVNNWIIWLPNNFGLWSPQNVLSVWSRGIEYDLKVRSQVGKVQIHFTGKYQHILSTNEKVNQGGDNSLQKQLIYVPIQKAQGSVRAVYKGFHFSCSHNYVGNRFTTSDNTQYLKQYNIINVDFGNAVDFNKLQLKFSVHVNNLWNESYQIINYYPMPGRNYQLGVILTYHRPSN